MGWCRSRALRGNIGPVRVRAPVRPALQSCGGRAPLRQVPHSRGHLSVALPVLLTCGPGAPASGTLPLVNGPGRHALRSPCLVYRTRTPLAGSWPAAWLLRGLRTPADKSGSDGYCLSPGDRGPDVARSASTESDCRRTLFVRHSDHAKDARRGPRHRRVGRRRVPSHVDHDVMRPLRLLLVAIAVVVALLVVGYVALAVLLSGTTN